MLFMKGVSSSVMFVQSTSEEGVPGKASDAVQEGVSSLVWCLVEMVQR